MEAAAKIVVFDQTEITEPVFKDFKQLNLPVKSEIKEILKVDYPRGRVKGYFANIISAKKLKNEFSLFHLSVSLPADISPDTGENIRKPCGKPRGIILLNQHNS